ncbi:zinc finger protein 670-like isoform X3 [Cavia porcellus]|uniref:zinc finger protein 670-like isoform X3 n=1 Tax=Cavia porcellus TaxID=10141 RepID=UPI000C87CECE|nr:zinc finger protein 670-like isoform X2 [Cavia porcellus]
MEAMSLEDVTVNFTKEEWALLNPSQKKLYRDVMWETFKNINAIGRTWDSQQMEKGFRNYSRKLRNEEVAMWYQCKTCNQHKNVYLWPSNVNADKTKSALNPAESFVCGEPLIVHLSLNMPILPHPGGKPRSCCAVQGTLENARSRWD